MPQAPAPLIAEMRTRSGVSFTAPELRQASFRLVPPGLALGEQVVAAAGKSDQGDEDEGADEIPTNSARHARTMRGIPLRTAQ